METGVFKQRQVVKKRRQWVRRLKQIERILLTTAGVLAGLAFIYGLYLLIFISGFFAVKNIVAEGEWRHLTAARLADLSQVMNTDNLFWLSMDEVHAKLMQEPWVKSAAVRRKPPDTLWIYAEEYKPIAIIGDGNLMYVDQSGKIFKQVDPAEEKDYPIFSGVGFDTPSDDTKTRVDGMIELMNSFRNSSFGKDLDVAEVHFDDAYGYSLVTKNKPMQIFFGYAAFNEVLAKLERLSDEIAKRNGRITYMMANEPERLIVKYRTPSAEAVVGSDASQDL